MAEKDFERNEEEALLPGAELWVVPDLNQSTWTQKIDWYLNFQILRSTQHRVAEPPPEMKSVIGDWELDPPKIELHKTSPLMIASAQLLPNHAVVVIPMSEQNQNWPESVHSVWAKLDKPSLRVFLPKSVTASNFVKAWPQSERETLNHALVQ